MNEPSPDTGLGARLVELESRFAYQEEALQVLSAEVARQARHIDQLEALCRELLERARSASEGVFRGTAADEVPPHY
jgi:SlyX protein